MLITVIDGKKNNKKNIVVVLATMMSVSPTLFSHTIAKSLISFIKYSICYLLFIISCALVLSLLLKQRICLYSDRIDVQFGLINKKYYLNHIEKCYLRNRKILNIKLKNGTHREIYMDQYNDSFLLIDYLKENNIYIEEIIV